MATPLSLQRHRTARLADFKLRYRLYLRLLSRAGLVVLRCEPTKEAPMPTAREAEPILVRRYARARLYDAAQGRYVSVEQLCEWDAGGVAFRVIDAETGEEIRRVLLA